MDLSGGKDNDEKENANVIEINTGKKCIRCDNKGALPNGFCLECVSANLKFKVPKEGEFDIADSDFIEAPELQKIASKLIKRYEDFEGIQAAKIIYLWKKTGGKRGGKIGQKNILGKCQKPAGLLKHFAMADFIIWLGADNCQDLSEYQITATVFHELKHAGFDEENSEFVVIPHDYEGWTREIELFGDYKYDIHLMRLAFEQSQPSLFEEAK